MSDFSEENNLKRFTANGEEYKFQIKSSYTNIEERKKEELSEAMKKYMPIGTIVRVEEKFKLYMIIGYNYQDGNDAHDYFACEYPFGVDSMHRPIVFNHEQIESVLHIGFMNAQGKKYKEDLLKQHENKEIEK